MKKSQILFHIILGGWIIEQKVLIERLARERERKDKNFWDAKVADKWLTDLHKGKKAEDYLSKNKYYTVAVYGMGFLGERLVEELEKSTIQVKYIIDQNVSIRHPRIRVLSLADELPEVDAIIVTPIYYFYEIREKLEKIVSCPIISLLDVV